MVLKDSLYKNRESVSDEKLLLLFFYFHARSPGLRKFTFTIILNGGFNFILGSSKTFYFFVRFRINLYSAALWKTRARIRRDRFKNSVTSELEAYQLHRYFRPFFSYDTAGQQIFAALIIFERDSNHLKSVEIQP